jgi:hypothetical protein
MDVYRINAMAISAGACIALSRGYGEAQVYYCQRFIVGLPGAGAACADVGV